MIGTMRISAEIDLDAISQNVRLIQEKVGDKTKILAVIKADGYGHGAVEIAHMLDKCNKIFGFAVATAEEAVELRRSGIANTIVVLGYVFPESFEDVIMYQITQTICSYDTAKKMSDIAERLHRTLNVHIKVDTGMGRIGFKPTVESAGLIKRISQLPNINIDGIFTHFACSDRKDKTSANGQYKKFVDFVAKVEAGGVRIPNKHCSNSSAIIDFDDKHMDMVRPGIMMYGLYPSEKVNKEAMILKPALSLKSHVAFLKNVDAGDTIGYGSTYVAPDKREIATIPVGYGDGYPRQLSGKGRVLIRGQFAPIVGRVCMDQFMVDVTDIEKVMVGDEVILVGTSEDKTISVEELVDNFGGFNYEFVCDINGRVPRVFIKNGEVIKIKSSMEC